MTRDLQFPNNGLVQTPCRERNPLKSSHSPASALVELLESGGKLVALTGERVVLVNGAGNVASEELLKISVVFEGLLVRSVIVEGVVVEMPFVV